jgi:thiol-disulfide isomerase/thioredoxin
MITSLIAMNFFLGLQPKVLFFVNSDCPIARRYSPEIVRIARAYDARATIKVIYCDLVAKPNEIAQHHREFLPKLTFLHDPKRKLAAGFSVRVVPTAVVVNSSGKAAYSGRIDNAYGEDFKWRKPTEFDLRNAIEAVLAGRAPYKAQTKVIGCAL